MSERTLRRNLRAFTPAQATLQTAALAAFDGREVAGMRIVARVAGMRERRAANGWIRFDAGPRAILVSPLLADGMLARITGDHGAPDGAVAAALLGRIEPLIGAIETILGVPLFPAGLADSVDEARLLLRLDTHDPAGPIRHRLLLALPDDLVLPDEGAPAPRIDRLPFRWRGELAGPVLRRARLAAISPGDLLLLGLGPLEARLRLPGRAVPVRARIDPVTRQAVLISDQDRGEPNVPISPDDAVQRPDADAQDSEATVPLADLPVPIRIEFDGGAVAAGTLAGLTEGSILPLPASGGTLPVRLLAGGAFWAEGEIVAVGEGYGVLVGAIRAAD